MDMHFLALTRDIVVVKMKSLAKDTSAASLLRYRGYGIRIRPTVFALLSPSL